MDKNIQDVIIIINELKYIKKKIEEIIENNELFFTHSTDDIIEHYLDHNREILADNIEPDFTITVKLKALLAAFAEIYFMVELDDTEEEDEHNR